MKPVRDVTSYAAMQTATPGSGCSKNKAVMVGSQCGSKMTLDIVQPAEGAFL
jgi:hypothetical protein